MKEIVEPALEVRHNPGAEPDEPLSDDARLDLLSDLVRNAAASPQRRSWA
ncbi:MAG: hypothetical protein OXI91_11610 [Chloroflexota bacterium]|nr:hypothetical protein [Chloroflexota bacterium]